MRALVCWVFALFFLKFDEIGNYDIRFKLRGAQNVSQDVVLITLKASDFSKMYDLRTSSIIKATELADLSDSFYWDRSLWTGLLKDILSQKPQKIGVTLYFGNNVGNIHFTPEEEVIYHDKRIIWASNSSEPEKLSLPMASKNNKPYSSPNLLIISVFNSSSVIILRFLFLVAFYNTLQTLEPFASCLTL